MNRHITSIEIEPGRIEPEMCSGYEPRMRVRSSALHRVKVELEVDDEALAVLLRNFRDDYGYEPDERQTRALSEGIVQGVFE